MKNHRSEGKPTERSFQRQQESSQFSYHTPVKTDRRDIIQEISKMCDQNNRQFTDIKQEIALIKNNYQIDRGSILNRVLILVTFIFFIAFVLVQEEYKDIKFNGSLIQELSLKLEQTHYQITAAQSNIQSTNKKLLKQIAKLKMELQDQKAYSRKLSDSIISLIQSELKKQQRDYNLLKKYSHQFTFNIDNSLSTFSKSFRIYQQKKINIIKKIDQQNRMFFSRNPIPKQQVYYFSIKVINSQNGMIGVGLITQEKRDQYLKQNCVYCQSEEMIYLYCRDGYLYNDEFASIYKKSKQTKISSVEQGDTISIFVDYEKGKVLFYVNDSHVRTENLSKKFKTTKLYSFVEMTNKVDQVAILI